ncbi:hypothetical protein LPL18_002815 [Halomonas sp. CUBES01]|uniref:hypothetical protein n=1 Tax=Halomonas sp. CUBES01 TaxID=2897340 RepID=UPI001E3C59D4|nr:hypothetical protein [Halomonas sp. CUBES01]MEC4766269.1 hypothetical protein [Halomonas sp. CUBES01]
MNRQALYGFLVGVAVLAAAIMWFYAVVMPQPVPSPSENLPSAESPEPTVSTREPDISESPADDLEPPAVDSDSAPPLFPQQASQAPSQTVPNGVMDDIGNPMGVADPGEVQRIQRELTNMTMAGNPSPERVASLLGELRVAIGRDEVSGVNLARLEETVQSAGRIQSLANEMQSIARNPSKEDQQRLQEMMTEMQRLQGTVSVNADTLTNVE